MPSSLLSFCLGATYDTLPSPSNLHRWNIITETSSKLCHKQICSTAHVLGACKFVLQQAGLLFDTVLFWMPLFLYSNLFFIISYTVSKTNHNASINYVKTGSKPQKSIKQESWSVTFCTRLEITLWSQQFVYHSTIYCSESVKTSCSLFFLYKDCYHFRTHLSLWGKHGGVA